MEPLAHMRHYGHPSISARIQGVTPAVAAENSSVYLIHDGAPNLVIAVLDLQVTTDVNDTFDIGYFQGAIPGPGMRGVPILPGQAAPIGITRGSTQVGSPGPVDYTIGNYAGYGAAWHHNFPFAVIYPGWALVVTESVVNHPCQVSFFYTVIESSILQSPEF